MKLAAIVTLIGGSLIMCKPSAFGYEVRLVGGRLPSEGRVEVFHQGVWGTVCYHYWDIRDATVVCRQLGYDGALEALRYYRACTAYGPGTGIVWLSLLQCVGNESSISSCGHSEWGEYTCSHSDDACVICNPSVRITGGPSAREGLVQVYHNNTWGSVCADQWNKQDADVVCKELGYSGASAVYKSSAGGNDTVWMNNVQCYGNESSLLLCAHDGWKNHSCINRVISGVVCIGPEVRLVGGTSVLEGRVEVLYRGVWGTVCADGDRQAGYIVCRQLAYDGATATPSYLQFSRGTGVIWLDNLQCAGHETSLGKCRHNGWGQQTSCNHYTDLIVVCTPSARLIGGPSVREGLVQVYHNNTWGWVCDDEWDRQDADVVCRELGYLGASVFRSSSGTDQGGSQVWMDKVQCVGNESSLTSCDHRGWGSHSCKRRRKAGATCDGNEVRLVGGNSPLQGRVEVLYNGTWGTVSQYRWDILDANVVCRQLGYDGAMAALHDAAFGEGKGMIWLDEVKCIGNERSIKDCMHKVAAYRQHHADASVVCSPRVRVTRGPSAREGVVQVYHNNTWGWVCADQWNKQDADVICRELGYNGASTVYKSSVRGGDTFWMKNVQCSGNESSLLLCAHDGWENHTCINRFIAGLVCIGPEVRLVGGNSASQGRVELLHNGVWGTVCMGGWSIEDANVVCRQLGYDGAAAAPRYADFGQGRGAVWMNRVQCTGNESSLVECAHLGMGVNCGHGLDVGAACMPKVRITGGPSAREGLVQVYHNNTWGWVCADQWNKQDADVVCRQLGYNGASADYKSSAIGGDTFWMNNVQCSGNESSLLLCAHDGWKNHSCKNRAIAEVVCIGPEVRLIGGNVASNAGRVEILLTGFWGTVCDLSWWDLPEANVVCRQLGYEKASIAPTEAAFGQGIGIVWTTSLQCLGNEKTLTQCKNSGWNLTSCRHDRDVSVICTPRVRLIGEPSARWEGLVQVYHNKTWGWVCDDEWDRQDADVVCRELGYIGSTAVYSDDANLNGNNTIWMRNVQCTGSESSLYYCAHNGWKNQSCGRGQQMAGVVCAGPEVRTVDVNSPLDGVVKVLFNGIWGSICESFWGLQEATVTCRQLGYQKASRSRCSCRRTQGVVPFDYVRCIGDEHSILDCSYKVSSRFCYRYGFASISCSPQAASVGKPLFVFSTFESIIISWNPVISANYTVKIWNNETHIWKDTNCAGSFADDSCVVDNPRAVMTGLTPLSEYYFKVYVNNATSSQPSGPMRTKDYASFLGRPRFVSSNHDSISIRWKPTRTPNYIIETSNNKTLSWRNTTCSESSAIGYCVVSSPRAKVTGLKPSSMYYFRIYVNDTIISPPSDAMETKKLETPGKPLFVGSTADTITITWPPLSLDGITYSVQMKTDDGILWQNATCTESLLLKHCVVTSSLATMTSLQRSVPIRFRVYVIFKGVWSNASLSSEPLTTTAPTLEKPQFVSSGLDYIILQWNSSISSKNYTVKMWNSHTMKWEDTSCRDSISVHYCVVTTTGAIVTELNPSSVYYFRIIASEAKPSPSSDAAKTKEIETPGKPLFVGSTADTITITWPSLALDGITYSVQMKTDEGILWQNATCTESLSLKQCVVTSPLATMTSLQRSVSIRFRVYAIFKGVWSNASLSSDPFSTAGDVCVVYQHF